LFACAFLSVEVLGMFGTIRHMVFFAIEEETPAAHIAGVRIAPDEARNLLDAENGFLRNAGYCNDNATLAPIECRSRLGGPLNYYHRKAA
jgi:hypothetical protein